MTELARLAMGFLLVLGATVANAADLTVRQFGQQVQPVLSLKLSSWRVAQSDLAARSATPVNLTALRSSAAATLGSPKATQQNIEIMVALVLAAVLDDAQQDIQRLAAEIDRNLTLRKQLHEALALLRESDATALVDMLDANPTLREAQRKKYDGVRKALEDAMQVQDLSSSLAIALQQALLRISQALQQLSAAMAVYTQNAASIIANMRG